MRHIETPIAFVRDEVCDGCEGSLNGAGPSVGHCRALAAGQGGAHLHAPNGLNNCRAGKVKFSADRAAPR